MRAEIIAVGTELLLGSTINTNASHIAIRLAEMGIDLYRHTVIGDNAGRLVAELRAALERCDLVITTGGLGPTEDDLTKAAVAEALGLPLLRDEHCVRTIAAFFEKISREMPQGNLRQADFPEGALIFDNSAGTAPGCAVERDGKRVIVLPGPPREMRQMFEESVVPYLSGLLNAVIVSRTLHFAGIGESAMEEKVRDLVIGSSNPTVAPYAKEGECELRISAKASSQEEAAALIAPVERDIRMRLGAECYGTDDDTLESVLISLLRRHGLSLTVAESCTGGMIASRLVNVPGASSVFPGALVAYDNAVKRDMLGVAGDILETHGAVSGACVEAMAREACRVFGTSASIAVSGIAGPEGGTPVKPVGTVWIACCVNGEVDTWMGVFPGTRNLIRLRATITALDRMRRILQTHGS